MASGIKKYDSMLVGAALGALVAFPDFAVKVNNFLVGIIPADWASTGTWVIPAILIGAGALIGLITERTR